ncbi:hypothetical protein ACIBEK_34400 [Nocardia fusca]|uniref:hypothetical protein n=1 Tax=Nocardia fusca TaxID=941183 RepID=UPI0037AB4F25
MLIDSLDMVEDPVVWVGEADDRGSLAQRGNHTPLVGAGALDRVGVVVGDAEVVDTSGDLDVVELA